MARLRNGDEQALAELYTCLAPQVYALVLRMLESREEAEEVLQDTFLRLHRKIDTYDLELGSPRAFAYTIARNEALSRLRARTARPVPALEQDVHDPATVLAGSEAPDPLTHMEVNHALATLDPKDRKLLQLVFFQGYSHTEVAKLVGLPLGTAKSRLRRALLQLRDRLEDQHAS